MDVNVIYNEDCLKGMEKISENSIDSIVTDPPYNLSFMGKQWDSIGTPKEFQEWNERWAKLAYRVLKPCGYLVVFGGTRTYHRMAAGVEDAGFEICDMFDWLYGSGFPKSHNISKGFDKLNDSIKVVGKGRAGKNALDQDSNWNKTYNPNEYDITEPNSDLAKQWEGYGTALKPAHEPILLAQKPREGTYCNNVEKYGCGGINIDGCRVNPNGDNLDGGATNGSVLDIDGFDRKWMHDKEKMEEFKKKMKDKVEHANKKGRFPANLLLTHHPDCELIGEKKVKGSQSKEERTLIDDKNNYGNSRKSGLGGFADKDGLETIANYNCVEGCPIKALDEQSGVLKSKDINGIYKGFRSDSNCYNDGKLIKKKFNGDKGGASRYFNQFQWQEEDFFLYTAKTSKSERTCNGNVENNHPTVKPLSLIRWLINLVTPKDGLTVDLFCGSGTHAVAAYLEGMNFIDFEKDKENWEVANARLDYYKEKPAQLQMF